MMDNIEMDTLDAGAGPWYLALFEANPLPMYIYDAETLRFLRVNLAAVQHYGFTEEEFLRMATSEIRPIEGVPALLAEIQELRLSGRTGFQKSPVRKHRKKDGSIIFVETAKELFVINGRQAICVLVNDVTCRVLAEKKIEHLAFYDELTNLPNRAKLQRDLQDAIMQAQDIEKSMALVIVELIRFREINYTLGHIIGDQLLRKIGLRIRQFAGINDTVARISNVQFGLFFPDIRDLDAIQLIGPLLNSLKEPISVGGIDYELGAHGGIVFFPHHGTDPHALIRHADIALYHARKIGRDFTIYDPANDPYQPQRLAMLGEFHKAIKAGQLRLYCQPKANLRTGLISSAEALVRWLHPTLGLIPPDQFIPLIEPTELIQPLTQWMLEAAIRQCHEWRQKGLVISLAVNLSARNLLDTTLPETIRRLLQIWEGDSNCIGLEITESSIMGDPAASLLILDQLHRMGCMLFVDDYGTGYSSLSYLMKLPVDVIKIDHSFTMHMIEDRHAATIVKSTIEMAHNMGMKVIAEGTASKEIWEVLASLGCDEAQGEYVSMPMPAMDFSAWLAQRLRPA